MSLTLYCNSATPFSEDGSLDEDALAIHLRRLVAAGNAISVGSGGAGEGHALTPDEYRRICEVAATEAGSRVATLAALHECRSAKEVLAIARQAALAAVGRIQIYQLDGGHGMVPTAHEQDRYYRTVLDAIDRPVALCIHRYSGYLPPTELLGRLIAEYPQVLALHVMGGHATRYFVELQAAMPSRIELFTDMYNLPERISIGAVGSLLSSNNVIPRTCHAAAAALEAGDVAAYRRSMGTVARFEAVVSPWGGANSRWVKMALLVLGLGNGVMREPYVLPGASDLDAMRRGLAALALDRSEGLQVEGLVA